MVTDMLFDDGDDCAMRHRTVNVTFVCGPQTRITSVSEPKTCRYVLAMTSPLACNGGLAGDYFLSAAFPCV
jgi:hypothetical protein